MNNKQLHIELVQGVINRLAHCSFLLKGWSVILVSALFALAASNTNIYFIYLAFFPAVAFWILDGYFLWQERLFRALYDHVRGLDENQIDFSMNTSSLTKNVKSWPRTTFSITLNIFHGVIIVSILIVICVI